MDPTTRGRTRLNRVATRVPIRSGEVARAVRLPERRRRHGRTPPTTAPGAPWIGRGAAQGLVAFVLYFGIAMVYIGRYAVRSPGSGTIGTGPDVQIFLWGLRWWAYALQHGLNPLHSSLIWSPYGTEVLWTTTVPLLGVIAAPLTLTLGVTVTWNILTVLAPALSAWAAYLLCRELTGNRWAAFIGGALFGFSGFELAQTVAHLQLTMNLCVPLAAWVLVRHLRGKLGRRGLALRVGALAVCQFLISPEVLSTMLVGGALAGLAAFALLPKQRADLRRATVCCGTLARALPAGSTAISLPFWDPKDRSLYAQATSGMPFRLVDEWVQDMPRRYQRLVASINRLTEGSDASALRSGAARLERELRTAGIDYVLAWSHNNAATRLLTALHLRPERVDGVLVYHLTGQSQPIHVRGLSRGLA